MKPRQALCPQQVEPEPAFSAHFPAGNGQFGMLGLGDIVIPGLLCSMCIRYDYIQAFLRGKEQAIKDGVRKSDLQEVQKYIEKEMHTYYFR